MTSLSLDELMRAAGRSLSDAQGQLLEGVPSAATTMAIAEATLEMKLTVEGARGGGLSVAAVSGALARSGAVNPAALSSVTMRFVALADRVMSDIAVPDAPATGHSPQGPAGPTVERPPKDIPPVVAQPAGPKKPLTRADMQAFMRDLPDVSALLREGVDVRLDYTTLASGQTLARAVGPDGKTITARVLGGND